MTKKKIAIAIAAAALAGTCAIGGTLAWLTSTAEVNNTFTMGDVNMVITETIPGTTSREEDGQEYKIVPGGTAAKDPRFEIAADSEAAWLFAYIDDDLKVGETAAVTEYAFSDGWVKVEGNLYVYGTKDQGTYTPTVVTANQDIPFFTEISFSDALVADKEDEKNGVTGNIDVKGFLIQSEKMDWNTALAAAKQSFGLNA